MIKVVATNASQLYGKGIKELSGIVSEGTVFEVTEERFNILSGQNRYGLVMVKRFEESAPVKAAEPVVEPIPDAPIEIPAEEEEPQIFVIEPGKEPVEVDKNLQPKKKSRKKKVTEDGEQQG